MSKWKVHFYLLLLSYVPAFPFAMTFLISTGAHTQLEREILYTTHLKSKTHKPHRPPQHTQGVLAQDAPGKYKWNEVMG